MTLSFAAKRGSDEAAMAADGDDAAIDSDVRRRLARWRERAERRSARSFRGLLLRQQGLFALLFIFLVYAPAWCWVMCRAEGWGAWESFIYVGTIVTTIGYGNTTPATVGGRLGTIVMGVGGIPLTGYGLAWIGHTAAAASRMLLVGIRARLGIRAAPKKATEIHFTLALVALHFAHCVAVFATMERWSYANAAYSDRRRRRDEPENERSRERDFGPRLPRRSSSRDAYSGPKEGARITFAR